MATVNFRLRSTANKNVSIFIYLSLGRGKIFQSKTGFSINPKDWSERTKRPKQNSGTNKKIYASLNKLQTFIFDKYNDSQASGENINKQWLDNKIEECFRRVAKTDRNLVSNHIQYIIDNAHTRKIKGYNRIGLSERRIAGYKTFKKIFLEYERKSRTNFHFTDISKDFVERFTSWLLNDKVYSISHSGKQIDNLKAVCRDADSLEIEIHPFALKIESFKENNEDRHIVTLSPEEIQKIKNAKITSEALINVRKWLIIGCAIGQRASDLLKLNSDHVRKENGNFYIDLIQQKTKKEVTVGIGDPDVISIIKNGELPYPISTQKLNKYLKKLCKKAEINTIIKGKKFDKKTKRKKLDFYPKYELITSHTFRRSFATNYYRKIELPVLMDMTGHSRESMFYEYINKKRPRDVNANIFIQRIKELNEN